MTTVDPHLRTANPVTTRSTPEPGTQFGTALLIATVVASPVLVSAFQGRQDVRVALGLYLAALVVVWVLSGIAGGVFAMIRPAPSEVDDDLDDLDDRATAHAPGSSR
ncbi:MAG: hypothetical protein ACXIVQ_00450 [Acidimicrobiales bacterium]